MPPNQRPDGPRVVLIGERPLAEGLAAGLVNAQVVAVGREVAADGGSPVEGIRCGFGSEQDVVDALAQAERRLGGIDQIVHAWYPPSVLFGADFTSIAEDDWSAGCEHALEAAWWVARHALEHLRLTRGSMVFVVPTIGMSGAAGFAMLAAVAEGLRVLAKGCGRQWGAHAVTANTVALAPHLLLGEAEGISLTRAVSLSAHALGTPGDPAADIAPLIGLLSRPEAHFLTAATLVADGGLWMGL